MLLTRGFSSFFADEVRSVAAKRVIVGHSVFRDTLVVNFSPIIARFVQKESYFTVRSRGSMLVEFIPREAHPSDPSRTTLRVRDKTFITIFSEDLVRCLRFEEPVSLKKDLGKVLEFKPEEHGWRCMLQVPDDEQPRSIVLKPDDVFYIKELARVSAS